MLSATVKPIWPNNGGVWWSTTLRILICAGVIAVATAWLVAPAAADDGEVCVRGSGEAAIEACTRAIKSGRYDRHNLAIIYSNRANQRERAGDFKNAIADHDEAIRIDPTYSAGYMHRGNAYARHGDFDRAIADHSEAVRLGPNDADVFYNRGYTYSHKGDHERAVADYTAGLALDANNSRLWGQRCWSRAMVGKQLKEAIEDCDKANSLAPKIPQILGYRGLVYLKLGQFDKAVADYDAALALTRNPNNAEWLYGRGFAKLKTGDNAGGNADIERAKTIKADIAEDYVKYGIR
jgi:tetratricopeptide (TPR) repeat protein